MTLECCRAPPSLTAYWARLVVYPGAYHGFDGPGPSRTYFGHHLEYNASAAELASEEVRRFLAEELVR